MRFSGCVIYFNYEILKKGSKEWIKDNNYTDERQSNGDGAGSSRGGVKI